MLQNFNSYSFKTLFNLYLYNKKKITENDIININFNDFLHFIATFNFVLIVDLKLLLCLKLLQLIFSFHFIY